MKEIQNIERIFLIGIGGIGMSALARYYKTNGLEVAGYDRVSTHLTDQLSTEGMNIHFQDDISNVPSSFIDNETSLIIYTPAVPDLNTELKYFRENGFEVIKRSEALSRIINENKTIAVAGTHGKTTVTGMIANIFNVSDTKASAFLGGISKNLNSNLLLNPASEYIIVEADEYDRSFLRIFPDIAVVTAIDADHLDIYGNYENLLSSFLSFINQIKIEGSLIVKKGLLPGYEPACSFYTYSLEEQADFYASEIRREGFLYRFDIHTPNGLYRDCKLGIYGRLNLENAIAAFAACYTAGIDPEAIKKGLESYSGIQRRFDVKIETKDLIYIDDYAHHPAELTAFISSVKEALPGKRICGIFQPHLYSRTRDFAEGFAKALSLADDVILMDIYPAREEPIAGITSLVIFEKLENKGERILCSKDEIFKNVEKLKPEVILTMGAGDIDQIVEVLKEKLLKR